MTIIDVPAARHLLGTDSATLAVDVRTPGEYESAHIPGSVNLPLDQVDAHLRRIVEGAGGRLILVCQGGTRAAQCQHKLEAAGMNDTLILDGGMNAWTASGAPTTRGRQRWAIERQVRLVAGSIVAFAVLASLLWEPAKFAALFIGAGLSVAALTDSCLMGTMLSKLPYNRPKRRIDIDASIARLTESRAGSPA